MRITVTDHAAEAAAAEVAARVRRAPQLVLGLATGRTMEPLYAALAAAYRRGDVSFAGVRAFLLDEYIGPGADDPRTFRHFVRRHWADHVDVTADRIAAPDTTLIPEVAAARYRDAIAAAGGIDLQLLGIGANGHIGFNEPPSGADTVARRVRLRPETRDANAGGGDPGQVPPEAITLGIADILAAGSVILVATGAHKAAALAAAVDGPEDPWQPASALQRHGDCHVFADPAAASVLRPRRMDT